MPVPDAPKLSRVKAPVATNTCKSSRLEAPVLPDSPKNSRIKALAATKVLNPQDFVRIQALPGSAQKEGKVLARSRTIYRSSEPPRKQVFWENYHRRQKQFTQGHFTPPGKPYRELGEILYTDAKKLTLYCLGQLAQEPAKKDVRERPFKEVAKVTTAEYSFNPKSDPLASVKGLASFRETGKELRTLSKALAHSRYHINAVKQGGEYFHILHQESLERKNTLNAQQAQGTRWRPDFQPPTYSSDAEESEEEINACSLTEGKHLKKSGKKKKKMTLRSFTPVYTSVLIPRPPEAKSEHLFRQLCAIHWLLEALTLESNGSMHSILTCWNPTDPGGCKKSVKEIEEEKLATCMWELFITNTKKYTRKARQSPLSRKNNKTSAPVISQLSSQSSHGQTPNGSVNSLVLCSEDKINMNGALSDVLSESVQTKEQPLFPSPQKLIQITHGELSKDVHKQEGMLKKTGLQSCHISSFIKSKSNLCADTRQKFTATREEAAFCLHDTLESLERSQEERCSLKYQALKQLKYFKKDMERIRQLGMRAEREHDKDGLKWFPVLLARLPESVKNDRYVQKILKKLEKFSMTPDLKIHQDTFLKALASLRVWELCSPEIAAAVEFVRESIVQMPEEDFSEWFQTRVALLSAQSSTF